MSMKYFGAKGAVRIMHKIGTKPETVKFAKQATARLQRVNGVKQIRVESGVRPITRDLVLTEADYAKPLRGFRSAHWTGSRLVVTF